MKWISVEEELPEIDEFVLWCHPSGNMMVCEIDKDGLHPWEERWGGYTHWMPLPEPPEE